MKLNRLLPLEFYLQDDVVSIAKQLLGKRIGTQIHGAITTGIITEVEAYSGRNDKACHANNGRRTSRTEVMYASGGVTYVYLCYGIHHMLNVVTNIEGQADAILVRAIEPIEGVSTMQKRRMKQSVDKSLTCGPGNVGMALGLNHRAHNNMTFLGPTIWIEESDNKISDANIVKTTRIGIDYAEEDAQKPWRFYLRDSSWVSRF